MGIDLIKHEDQIVKLPPCGGLPAGVHLLAAREALALSTALSARRPLLVRGEPGTGKSQLARAAAALLGRAFLSHVVDARTETRDLLWTIDAVARLAEAQVLGALGVRDETAVRDRMDVGRFLHPGVLWWAFEWASAQAQAQRATIKITPPAVPAGTDPNAGPVVLIDEIDKADAAVPNGLLDALGHGCFDVPGRAPVRMAAEPAPLVILTTNEERTLPDAFLRRCLVLHLGLPEKDAELRAALVQRGRAHFEDAAPAVLAQAAELLAKDRAAVKAQGQMPPGCAEYLDLLRAVTGLATDAEAQLALLARLAGFALRKHAPEQAP